MPRKNRMINQTIYDKDATVVIQNATNDVVHMSDSMNVFKSSGNGDAGTTIKVEDVLETMAGYMVPNFRFVDTSEKGTCMMCGKETSIASRKLCGDCMKESGERLYYLSKQAIENGEKEVTI